MPDVAEYLTPQSIAKLLGVSDNHVSNLIRRGELRGIRVGRLLRVHLQDFDHWLKENSVTTK